MAASFAVAPPGARTEAVIRAIVASVFAASPERRAALACVVAHTTRSDPGEDVRALVAAITHHLVSEGGLTEAQALVLTRAVLGVASAALAEAPDSEADAVAAALVGLVGGVRPHRS